MNQIIPNGLSESFEEYAVRCEVLCSCPDSHKKYYLRHPESDLRDRSLSTLSALPAEHIPSCPLNPVYIRWKANNRRIYELIKPAVVAECEKLRMKSYL